ncbi:MAG: hypothetical protein GX447_06035 [Elusimicrobia bacterium]|nr:hypothetical protein [Elusimicrobiota bacterium]
MNFFQSQTDYIFFIYGFSFFLLSAAAFFLKKNRNDGIYWEQISYFALTHGLSEWLDMIAFIFGDSIVFNSFRTFLMILSFFFLFEFSFKTLSISKDLKETYKFYILPTALTAIFFVKYDHFAGNAAARYFFAFPSSLFASFILFSFYKKIQGKDKKILLSAALAFFIYSLFSGLVVPKADFFPASVLNYDSFQNIFHIPVQLIRAFLASLSAFILWRLYLSSIENSANSSKREYYGNMLAFEIAAILIFGWIFTDYLGRSAFKNVKEISENTEKAFSGTIRNHMRAAEGASKAIAESPWVKSPDFENKNYINNANSVLDRYCSSFSFSVCYIMDKKGTVRASSDRKNEKTFMNKNYSFRPYFQSAIKGKIGKYFAKGVTSGEKGFYAAAPIKKNGEIAGVAAIKTNISLMNEIFSISENAYLLSPEGIIFSSSDSQSEGSPMWPIRGELISKISESNQFGDLKNEPYLKKEIKDDEIIQVSGKNVLVSRAYLSDFGWSVVILHNLHRVDSVRFYGILFIIVFSLTVLLFFIFLVSEQTAKENAQAMLELSQKVETLEGIIPICANCKKIRDDKGYWNKVESYISKHSKASFSHSLCPDCEKKLYPQFQEENKKYEPKKLI